MSGRNVHLVIVVMIVTTNLIGMITSIPHETSAYTLHDPISIDGDANFTAQAAAQGWSGDGTEGNPYVIEGYEFPEISVNRIDIDNTRVHFIIRDSKFQGDRWWGISLNNATNGTITGSIVETSGAIDIHRCSEIKIINNTISSENSGIVLSYSTKITIQNNTLPDYGINLYGNELEHWNTHEIDVSNTVNSRTLYFLKDQSGVVIPSDAGQVILANCTNIAVQNQNFVNTGRGLHIAFSSNNTIRNNSFSSIRGSGIFLLKSDGNDVFGNKLDSEEFIGMWIQDSNENNISNNELSCDYIDIYLIISTENRLFNNTMNDKGIYIAGNSVEHWNSNTIDPTNTVSGKPVYFWKDRKGGTVSNGAGQVILSNCTDVIVENQEFTNVSVGVEVGFSSNCIIRDNGFESSSLYGMMIQGGYENTIIENNFTNNRYGLEIYNSNKNQIEHNNATSNTYGFRISASNETNISNNTFLDNREGIHIGYSYRNLVHNNHFAMNRDAIRIRKSRHNNITSNIFLNNSIGIYLTEAHENNIVGNNVSCWMPHNGLKLEESHNNTISNNIITNNINGISIYDSNESRIIGNRIHNNLDGIRIVNSMRSEISYNSVELNTRRGIILENSNETEIFHNFIFDNHIDGIRVTLSSDVLIRHNELIDNRNGLFFHTANQSVIERNDFTLNSRGFSLVNSSENIVIYNNISDCVTGIDIENCNRNIFHHNNFIATHFSVSQEEADNTWHDEKSQGNFWDDYGGKDLDGDGIGDTDLPHWGVDYNPIVEPNPLPSLFSNPWFISSVFFLAILIIIVLTVPIRNLRKSMKAQDDSGEGVEQDEEMDEPQGDEVNLEETSQNQNPNNTTKEQPKF